ncbi:hypothetical protein D3C79_537130 [compost metagenome]
MRAGCNQRMVPTDALIRFFCDAPGADLVTLTDLVFGAKHDVATVWSQLASGQIQHVDMQHIRQPGKLRVTVGQPRLHPEAGQEGFKAWGQITLADPSQKTVQGLVGMRLQAHDQAHHATPFTTARGTDMCASVNILAKPCPSRLSTGGLPSKGLNSRKRVLIASA